MLVSDGISFMGAEENRPWLFEEWKPVVSRQYVHKSEVDYRKAIEANSRFPQAHFNLGNALLRQQKPKEAMQAYEQAVKVETNKGRLASIYHNMGVILQSQKQFGPAIECYKNALRRNPADNESRYNLVLCQHQLKNNPQQDQQKRQ